MCSHFVCHSGECFRGIYGCEKWELAVQNWKPTEAGISSPKKNLFLSINVFTVADGWIRKNLNFKWMGTFFNVQRPWWISPCVRLCAGDEREPGWRGYSEVWRPGRPRALAAGQRVHPHEGLSGAQLEQPDLHPLPQPAAQAWIFPVPLPR